MEMRKVIVNYGYKKRILMIEAETNKAYLVKPKGEINLWLPKSKMDGYVISGEDFDYFYKKEIERMQGKIKEIIVEYEQCRKILKIEAETKKAYLVKPNDDMKLWLPKSMTINSEIDGKIIIDGKDYDYFYGNELIKSGKIEGLKKHLYHITRIFAYY